MALMNRQEFAVLCKTTSAVINTNITRNKITVTPDNKSIDTDNPLNKAFRLKYQKKAKEEANGEVTERRNNRMASRKVEPPIQQLYNEVVETYAKHETPAAKQAREKQNEEDGEAVNWDKRKKVADALRAEQLAEKERINVEKAMGKLMPVDLVMQIFSINIRNILFSFEAQAQNLGGVYCDILAGGDRGKLAEIVGKLRERLTYLTDTAAKTAALEIDNAISEYADARSRGERK